MDVRMVAQEHVALARSLLDLFNHRQSDPAWLEKSMAAFAADCEVVDAASGTTFHGPEGYKRLMLFSTEHFPDFRAELSTVFATEDHVTLEGTWRRTNAGPLSLPEASLPVRGHAGGVLVCIVLQIRHGKIVSLHCYCDLTTLLEQLGFNAATAQAM
jgi:predicted ester cyclase